MNIVYILLGSNDGDRMQILSDALTDLQKTDKVLAQSHIYETAAWGLEDQPAFLNMAACIETTLSAHGFLAEIHSIENKAGRQRSLKWGQRTLDIDILFYNNDIIDTADLKVPHPFIQKRMFALAPMSEIAPEYLHPVLHKTIAKLKADCPDPLPVKRL